MISWLAKMAYHQNDIEDFKNTTRLFEEDTREEIYKNNLAKIFHNIWIELAVRKFGVIFLNREKREQMRSWCQLTRTAPIMVTSPNGRIWSALKWTIRWIPSISDLNTEFSFCETFLHFVCHQYYSSLLLLLHCNFYDMTLELWTKKEKHIDKHGDTVYWQPKPYSGDCWINE